MFLVSSYCNCFRYDKPNFLPAVVKLSTCYFKKKIGNDGLTHIFYMAKKIRVRKSGADLLIIRCYQFVSLIVPLLPSITIFFVLSTSPFIIADDSGFSTARSISRFIGRAPKVTS